MTLPATGPYVDRIIRIFTDRPMDDTTSVVLLDYANAALAAHPASASAWEPVGEIMDDPWAQVGFFREKLKQAEAEVEIWKTRAFDARAALTAPPATPAVVERRPGNSKLVYNKATRTIDTVWATPAVEITEDMVKSAAQEYLSHKGERPRRVLRGGMELWETCTPAMRAALAAALSAKG